MTVSRRTIDALTMMQPQAFSYDATAQAFNVGEVSIAEKRIVDVWDMGAKESSVEMTTRLIENEPLAATHARLIMLPRMYDWLTKHLTARVADETSMVMSEVYARVQPHKTNSVPIQTKNGLGLGDFSVHRIRTEHPHIVLSALGNCACLGVDLESQSHLSNGIWDEKLGEFGEHNVDTDAQRVSLLAGLGHVAFLAAKT